ncbi:hypothetical protein JXM67_09490 [candidate division WOR-3 bacterium]|nr:hypothetical protein [candidate division WOR-3 bacterium]
MKRLVALMLLALSGFAFLSMVCEDSEEIAENKTLGNPLQYPPVENLDFEVVDGQDANPGGGVRVFWDPPIGETPSMYYVSVDGMGQDPVTETEDYVYTPCVKIEVYAMYDLVKSEPKELSFLAVETENFRVWTINDPSPDHPNAFGYSTGGLVSSYTVGNSGDWPHIDFWINTGPMLVSPFDHSPEPLNDEVNAASVETGTYDDLGLVAPTGQALYSTQQNLEVNDLLGLWIDPDAAGYTDDDNFGKLYVEAIDGEGLTLKLAYQTVTGLRWVCTEEAHTGIRED